MSNGQVKDMFYGTNKEVSEEGSIPGCAGD